MAGQAGAPLQLPTPRGPELVRPEAPPRPDAPTQDERCQRSPQLCAPPSPPPPSSPTRQPPDWATSFVHDLWYDLHNNWEDFHGALLQEVRGIAAETCEEQRSLAEASGRRQEELLRKVAEVTSAGQGQAASQGAALARQVGDIARDVARHHALVSELLLRLADGGPGGGGGGAELGGAPPAPQAAGPLLSRRRYLDWPSSEQQAERTASAGTARETASQATMTSAWLGGAALGGFDAATGEAAPQATMTPTLLGRGAPSGSGAASKFENASPPAFFPAVRGKCAQEGADVQGAEHPGVQEATAERLEEHPAKASRSSVSYLSTSTEDSNTFCVQRLKSLQEFDVVPHRASQSFARSLAERFYAAYMDIKEPERTGFLVNLERSAIHVFGFVIFINACWMTWFVNYQAQNPNDVAAWIYHVEKVFLTIYWVELSIRIAAHRLYFFCNDDAGWNWLDFLIVFIDTIETSLADGNARGFSFVRVLRALKVTRVLRVFRLVHFLKELRLIWDCLVGSIRSLFWSIIMMMLIVYMFSLVFVQGASTYLAQNDDADGPADQKNREALIAKFGSMSNSILSLYAAITGGTDWIDVYYAISPAGALYSYLFLFFIGFCQISLLNILTGIFVENALELAQPTKEQRALEKHNEEIAVTMDLQRLVSAFDAAGSGRICVDTFFTEVVGSPLHAFLHSIDVSVKELKAFVEIIGADKRGFISVGSLVHGCTLARGNARNLDMQRVLFDVKHMRREQAAMFRALSVNVGMALAEGRSSTDSNPETPRSAQSAD